VPTCSFSEADQKIAAAVGERKREEKRSTFDLEPPMAGHRSFSNRFGGHGAELVIGPRFARTRWRLSPPCPGCSHAGWAASEFRGACPNLVFPLSLFRFWNEIPASVVHATGMFFDVLEGAYVRDWRISGARG
jgi:hypothetical protein